MSLRALAWGLASAGLFVTLPARGEEPGVVVHDEPLSRASRRDRSAASTVIRKEELERPGAGASDVLATVPGVQVARSGSSSDFATASLRGATSAQTPVYLAGIRLNDDVSGSADLSLVPLWMLDRVEVFRGSTPDDADRMGIGGAILFEPRLPRRSTLGAGMGAGSFGERSAWVGGASAGEGAGALVAVRREHADNDFPYLDDRGTAFDASDDRVVDRRNADSDSWDAWAIGRTELGPGARVTTVLNAFSREQGVPGLGTAPALRVRARVERLLAGVSADLPCTLPRPGEPAGACTLELRQSALSASQTYRDPDNELQLGTSTLSTHGLRSSSSAHVVVWPTDALRVRAGAGGEVELLGVARGTGAGLDARREVGRADLSARIALSEQLELGVLGALECHGTRGPGTATRCDPLAPGVRAGATFQPNANVVLLANVGRYVRVPTLGELYGSSAFVLGNSALSPERGVTADAGVRALGAGRRARVSVDLYGFVRQASDLVAYRRSSFSAVRPYNIGTARVMGLELAGAAEALSHLRLDASATLSDPRNVTAGRQVVADLIPFQSRLAGFARLELFHEPDEIADRFGIGASGRYRSSRVADPAGLVIIPEQYSFGLDASALFWSRRLALRAALDDLFDARLLDSVGYPLPGRSYHASAELWW
jgi:vitamin B12 transporter